MSPNHIEHHSLARVQACAAATAWAPACLGAAILLGCGATPAPEHDPRGSTTHDIATSTGSGVASGTEASTLGASDTGEPAPIWRIALETDATQGALYSVWGPSSDTVYAVGGQQPAVGESTGLMLRREGGQWMTVVLPEATPKLHWVHGRGDLLVVVGERGRILMGQADGSEVAWTEASCGTVLPLWGAWARAEDDVWAVGGDGFSRDPVLCHYDGEVWSKLDLPKHSVASKGLFKLFATGPDDLWAVGDAALLLHHAAGAWTQVVLDTDADLISLWGRGPDDLVAVGGRAGGVLARTSGADWAVQPLRDTPGLNGAWMDERGATTIVGALGTIGVVEPGALIPVEQVSGTRLTLHGVWGADDGTRYAVGGSIDAAPPFVGIILESRAE